MNGYVSGQVIKELRLAKDLTQTQLAQQVGVTDKAVSKWETGRGLPDVFLLEPLANALGTSVAELLAGRAVTNTNQAGNMLRQVFYVCPVCGNVVAAMGPGSVSCCGVTLLPQEAEVPDGAHDLQVQHVDGQYHVTMDHPMEKEHYLSFIAYATSGRLMLEKLYPEQGIDVHFPICGSGKILAYCNRHGLFAMKTPPRPPRVRG